MIVEAVIGRSSDQTKDEEVKGSVQGRRNWTTRGEPRKGARGKDRTQAHGRVDVPSLLTSVLVLSASLSTYVGRYLSLCPCLYLDSLVLDGIGGTRTLVIQTRGSLRPRRGVRLSHPSPPSERLSQRQYH